MMKYQFHQWRKPEYPDETTDLQKVTDETCTHIRPMPSPQPGPQKCEAQWLILYIVDLYFYIMDIIFNRTIFSILRKKWQKGGIITLCERWNASNSICFYWQRKQAATNIINYVTLIMGWEADGGVTCGQIKEVQQYIIDWKQWIKLELNGRVTSITTWTSSSKKQ